MAKKEEVPCKKHILRYNNSTNIYQWQKTFVEFMVELISDEAKIHEGL